MYKEDPKVKNLVNDGLNAILEDLDNVQYEASYIDAVRWIADIQAQIRQLERYAVLAAMFDGGASKTDIAEALNATRQTLENRWGKAISAEQETRRTRERGFKKVEGYEFVGGKLQPKVEAINEKDFTEEQKRFQSEMRRALQAHPDKYEDIITKALEAAIIPPKLVMRDRKFVAFIQGDSDMLFSEHIPEDQHEAYKVMAKHWLGWTITDEERAAFDKWMGRHDQPKKQTALKRLPKPILPEWNKYKKSVEHPSYTEFAKRFGVSRSTVSRAVAREESEQA